jgi:protein involved in temperature-dependent protein secretion
VTDWQGGEEGLVRGVGQRTLLVGEEALGILAIGELIIRGGPEAATAGDGDV